MTESIKNYFLFFIGSALFAAFDKAFDPSGSPLKADEENVGGGEGEGVREGTNINSSASATVLSELSQVLIPDLAYDAYVTFYHLVGRAHLDSNIPNLDLIQILCANFEEKDAIRPATFAHFRLSHAANLSQESPNILASSSGSKGGGNMISVATSDGTQSQNSNSYTATPAASQSILLQSMITKEVASSTRHLKGNWLAYWEHEIGRAESDQHFNLKQILLQSYVGHSAGVKCLYVLDNENSFLSGGGAKDRTVKIWSIRSQGDGSTAATPQWTYGSHKKSICAVSFLESLRLAVSSDSTAIHVWDPFVGSSIHQIDSTKLGTIAVMATYGPDGYFHGSVGR